MIQNPSNEAQRAMVYREYLCLLARRQLEAGWTSRIDVSGIVQQTLWEASRSPLPQSDTELLACLRTILANNLRDEVRKLTRAKRDVRREKSLEEALEQSSQRLEAWLAQDISTPDRQLDRAQQLCRLAGALAALNEDQRQVVELHHLQGLPIGVTDSTTTRWVSDRRSRADWVLFGLEQCKVNADNLHQFDKPMSNTCGRGAKKSRRSQWPQYSRFLDVSGPNGLPTESTDRRFPSSSQKLSMSLAS